MNSDRSNFNLWKDISSSFLLIAAWCYAHVSSLTWLLQSFRANSWLNWGLIGGGIAVVLSQGMRHHLRAHLSAAPVLRLYPLLMMLAGGGGAIALRWFWDFPQIAVLLVALGSYGLCGLFLDPSTWRKGLPTALLFSCILPFSSQFNTGLGFPVRILTAHAVEQLLSTWNVTAVSSNDIIMLENGIARVDLPCSGLKGLWIGTLFLLAVTWLERRQIGVRWLLMYGISLWLLISANLVRVLLLVLVAFVFKQPQTAEVLHIPLGLLGFVFACGVGWGLLHWVPKQGAREQRNKAQTPLSTQPPSKPPDKAVPDRTINPTSKILSPLPAQAALIAAIASLGLIASLHSPPLLKEIAPPSLPPQIQAQAISLTPVEQGFFADSPATAAQKWRFAAGNLTGSILIVTSRSLNAFHPPEVCLVSSGLKVDRMEKVQLTETILARWLSLQSGKVSATYWLQSSQSTTDDFLSRLWEYVVHQNRTWVLVSVLFDQAYDATDLAIQSFVTTIHGAIARHLTA